MTEPAGGSGDGGGVGDGGVGTGDGTGMFLQSLSLWHGVTPSLPQHAPGPL